MSPKLLLFISAAILTLFCLPRFTRSYTKLRPILRPKRATLASSARQPRELIFPPCELDGVDIALCMAFLVVRICSAAVWRLVTFGFLHSTSGKLEVTRMDDAAGSDGKQYHLPDAQCISLNMPLQADLALQLRQYRAAIRQSAYMDASSAGKLHPLHWPLLFSAIIMPAALLVLASADCPIQPLGSVNVRNVFEIIDHEACTKLLNSSSGANRRETKSPGTDLYIQAKLSRVVLPVRRGWEVSIIVNIIAQTSGRAIFKQTFVLLHNEKHSLADPTAPQEPAPTTSLQALGSALRVSGSDPYLWAKLCRDYNPIHTAYPLARLFGFRQRIMHGNHVAAKAVQAYIDARPE